MKRTLNSIKRTDIILLAVLIIIAAAIGGYYYVKAHKKPAIVAEIHSGSDIIATLDLSEDQEYLVSNGRRGTNLIVVKDGQVWCETASCPDQICVLEGKQDEAGSLIVCLPNEMLVAIVSEDDNK